VQPAVIITKNGKYYGIVDHRSVSAVIRNPANTKCESAIAKPPVLTADADMLERVGAFMVGHFKAVPVVNGKLEPIGITSRVELLNDMVKQKLIPPMKLCDIMSKPVYTIDENETVAGAKRILKDKNARRLVVTRKNNPVGLVSVYDMSALEARSNLATGRKDIKSQNVSVSDMKISGFVRPDMTIVGEGASLQEAIQKMVDKQVSGVIVLSGKEPVGVVSALDVFKKILEMAQEGMQIQISGLNQDDIDQYDHIKQKFTHVLGKFSKTFNIRNVSVHVKENKSVYDVGIYLDTDDGHIALKVEKADVQAAVDELASEVEHMLRKKKDIKVIKPRNTHARGRE
jgi:CBS domain-containing protein/ribosome-associated translation inhibitor RaiA